ncbi:MAG: type III pantothenate kinase [Thermodesulfobacteriota bacterium]
MLLCIDVGNTNIVIGIYNDEVLSTHWRVRTERDMTSDEVGLLLDNLFRPAKLKVRRITDVIISCVVPTLLSAFREFSLLSLHREPLIVSAETESGITLHYDNPKEIGADRIVNAAAAYHKYRRALVVVDFGTATTFDYVSAEGVYEGGAIAPGITISAEALFLKASKLPRVEIFAKPKQVVAKETMSSINSGLIYGYAGLVDGIVERMKTQTQSDPLVIATGGLAPLIKSEAKTIDRVEEFLTLEGLKMLFSMNAPQKR